MREEGSRSAQRGGEQAASDSEAAGRESEMDGRSREVSLFARLPDSISLTHRWPASSHHCLPAVSQWAAARAAIANEGRGLD